MVLFLEEDEDTKPEQPHRTYVYSIVQVFISSFVASYFQPQDKKNNTGFWVKAICRNNKMLSLRQSSFPFSKPEGKFSTQEWSQHMKSLPDAKDNDDEDEESEAEESEAEAEEESETEESEVDESEVEESEVEESEAEESEAEDINSESDADEEPPRNLTAINQNMRNLSMARQDKGNYV